MKYNQGRLIAGQYGERMMFTTTDNRVLFLDPETAGKIDAAGIQRAREFHHQPEMGWRQGLGSPMLWEGVPECLTITNLASYRLNSSTTGCSVVELSSPLHNRT